MGTLTLSPEKQTKRFLRFLRAVKRHLLFALSNQSYSWKRIILTFSISPTTFFPSQTFCWHHVPFVNKITQ